VGVPVAHDQRVATFMTGIGVRLRITVINASGLRSADWNGKSDPYVLGELVGKPHTQFRTKTIERTLDPEWDEEKIIDDFEVGDQLQLKVMDEDNKIKQAFVGDDPLGSVILPSQEFYPNGFFGGLILSDDQGSGDDATLRLSIAVEDLAAPDMPPYGSTYGDPALLPRDLYPDQQFAPPTATLPPGAFDDHPMPPTGTLPPSSFANGNDAPPDAAGSDSHATLGSQVKRLRVVITGAEGLRNADWIGKSDPYCVCEVPGKPYTRFKTEVRSNTLEPVWNKQCDFDYTPGDPLEFSVFDKDIWPKSDDFLGRARLLAEHFYPSGFDGDLPLDDQGFLHISVMLLGGGSSSGVAADGHHTPQPSHPPPHPQPQAHQARTPPRAEPRAPPLAEPVSQVWSGEPHRLRITLVGARGVSLADGGTRCDLCCACEIPRRAGSGFQTKIASGTSGNPVWNHEQEIHDYFPGESLEFMILNRARTGGYGYASGAEGDIVGSCVLNSEQFFPFGYDAELTIFSPGQGIRGLLRAKVTLLDGPCMESRSLHVTSTRSVGSSLTTGLHPISMRGLSSEVLPITSSSARGTELRPISASAYAPRALEPARSQGLPLTSFSDIQVLDRGEATGMSKSWLVQPMSSTTGRSSSISAARVLPGSSVLGESSSVAAVPASPLRSMVSQPASMTSMAAQQLPRTATHCSTSLTSATSLPISSLSSNTSTSMAVARAQPPMGSINSMNKHMASAYAHQPRRPISQEEIVVSNPTVTHSSPMARHRAPLVVPGSTYSGHMGVHGASLGRALPRTVPTNTSPRPMTSIPVRLL